jgi:acylglycerol lipase
MAREAFESFTTAADGTLICIRAWNSEQPARILLCIQGLGGHGGYYDVLAGASELADTLIVAPDLRGHGHSQGTRGDIVDFRLYLADIESAVAWARARWPTLPLILLSESMGASLAIHYLSSRLPHVAEVAGLVLVSPVLKPTIQPRPGEVLRYLFLLLTAPHRPAMPITGREELGCRDAAFNARLRSDPLFVRQVSVRFLNRLSRWIASARRRGAAITLPVLILQGSRDYITRASGTQAFLRRLQSKEVAVFTFEGAYHSLLHDPATPELLATLRRWLQEQQKRRSAEASARIT